MERTSRGVDGGVRLASDFRRGQSTRPTFDYEAAPEPLGLDAFTVVWAFIGGAGIVGALSWVLA